MVSYICALKTLMGKKFSVPRVPRGTVDILPDQTPSWRTMEEKARRLFQIYAYQEIRTPLFEETGLFSRSLGQTSDVVQKHMLNLASGKETKYSLRPEGTAPVVRLYIENHIYKKEPLSKFFYIGPMFRAERPQKGRLRQFHHIGVEALGVSAPLIDAEVIGLSIHLLTEFGLKGFKLKINSLGSAEDKKNFSRFLKKELKSHVSSLCEDCQNRFERNVFRILDCKNKGCRRVVEGLDLSGTHLSEESRAFFDKVKNSLTELNIPFEVCPSLVRGLDYYTHTVFEISHPSLGSQDAIGAGGRYDGLVQDLGGPSTGAVGFALGVERMLLALDLKEADEFPLDVFIVTMGQEAEEKAFTLLNEIRGLGLSCDMAYQTGSLKSQMRVANKRKAKDVLILGEDELKENKIMLKDMESGEQEKVAFSEVGRCILKKRGRG